MTSQEQELLTRVARARWDKRREIVARYGFDIAKWDDLPGLDRDEEIECARAAIEAMMRAADEVPYDPHGAEVTTLHNWFAEHYSPAEWMDDGCRSENARDLLNALSKAGFIIVPTSLFRLSKGEE